MEHSFQEVMKQWARLCKYKEDTCNTVDRCDECDLYGLLCGFKPNEHCVFIEMAEKYIMDWAETHPEPVYPTWYEYLTDMYPASWDIFSKKNIPSDIAYKLGIEPKEG